MNTQDEFDHKAHETVIKKRAYLYGDENPAADMIRHKLDALYKKEPDAVEEAVESVAMGNHRSKHQLYMYDLSTSGKSLVDIQAAWHSYYARLSDIEKHAVWQEFYAANQQQSALFKTQATLPVTQQAYSGGQTSQKIVPTDMTPVIAYEQDTPTNKQRSVAEIKKQITSRVKVRGKLTKRQHLQSLGFGLAMGSLVIVFLLFGFFNERFIAPFITPSRNVSATPLILDSNNSAVDPSPQIIIPKINVQTPVVYDVATILDNDVQAGLERGIVHYATTSQPGEQGNAVFFGHSSSNIFNRGKYKYAFVLLSWLETNDTFYVQKGGVRYVYKVYEKKIVKPSEVGVLQALVGHPATATLITCDPPGTNVNRLVVIGDQISPSQTANGASTATNTKAVPKVLSGNSVSLWQRMTSWL